MNERSEKKPTGDDRPPQYAGNVPSNGGPPIIPKTPGWNSDEKDHRAKERDHWTHQKRTNNITLGISAVALIGAIASAIVSSLSLNAAITAIKEATRQSDAAEKQVRVSEDQERQSLRSYVGVSEHKIEKVSDGSIPSLSLLFKNFGSTPAREVRYWFYTKFDSYPNPKDLPEQPLRDETIILFPTDTFGPAFNLDKALNSTDIAGLEKGDRRLYFYGKVNYLDAFGCLHFTKFRLIYGGAKSVELGRMGWAEEGNETDQKCPE
jgi:hypothetical protein